MITIIAAVARNRAIGFNNKLIYWLPNDLKRFKQLTTGHTIVMGRRTFESLPKGALPNRRNIVLSRTTQGFPGCDTYVSLREALSHCSPDEDIYIIGGASVYRQAMPVADRLCRPRLTTRPPRPTPSSLTTASGMRCGARTIQSTSVTITPIRSSTMRGRSNLL